MLAIEIYDEEEVDDLGRIAFSVVLVTRMQISTSPFPCPQGVPELPPHT